jgi:hypothetical protein
MKIKIAAVIFFCLLPFSAMAQNTTGLVVAACGTVSSAFKVGNPGPFTVDTTGKLCTATSGGGGTPGSPVSSLQYNNAGAFGGVSGWTSNGTTALTGGASTTLAIGGATIGSNALAVTGAANVSGNVTIGAGSAITSSGPGGALATPAFAAFGTAAGTVAQGGVITAGGPTGSATVVPIITYNAAGQLTAVTTATVASAVTSKVINSTYDLTTASGTQTITFAFPPSSCNVYGTVGGVTNQYTVYNGQIDSSGTQSTMYAQTNITYITGFLFNVVDVTGSNFQSGVGSFSGNSLIITWTKGGIPTGTFNQSIKCFK